MLITSFQILKYLADNKRPDFPLQQEIDRLLIPLFNQPLLVEKQSLIGRILILGTKHQPKKQSMQAMRTKEIVIGAFEHYRNVAKNKGHHRTAVLLPLNFQIALNGLKNEIAADQPTEIHRELRIVKEEQEVLIETKRRNLFDKLTPLLTPFRESANEAAIRFKQLFNESSDEKSTLTLFKNFIANLPQETIREYERESAYLEDALSTSRVFEKSILSTYKKTDREDKYADKAGRVVDELSRLQPGERWLYCGQFFDTLVSIDDFYRLYRKSPQGLKAFLSEATRKQIEKNETLDAMLEELLGNYWQSHLDPLIANLDSINPIKIVQEVISPLLTQAEEHLKKMDVKIADQVKTAFITTLQQEIEMSAGDREWLQLVHRLFQATGMDPAKRKEELYPLVLDLFKKILEKTRPHFAQMTDSLQAAIPLSLQNTFDLHFGRSFFWFECVKQENGAFTISIYSTGKLERILDQSGQGEPSICWPYILKNVPEERLSPQFFKRLFFLLIEPHFGQLKVNKEALLEGLLSHFDGQSTQEQRRMIRLKQNPTSFDLIASRLLLSPASLPRLEWQMRYEIFMQHFKSYWDQKEKQLKLSVEESDGFLKILEQLISKRSGIQNRPGMPSLEELTIIKQLIQESVKGKERTGSSSMSLLSGFSNEMSHTVSTMQTVGPLERANSFLQRFLSNLGLPIHKLKQLKKLIDTFSTLLDVLKIALLFAYKKQAGLIYFLNLTVKQLYNHPTLIPQIKNKVEEIKQFINRLVYSFFIMSFQWLGGKFIDSALKEEEKAVFNKKISQLLAIGQLVLKDYFGKLEINWEVSQQQSALTTSIQLPETDRFTISPKKELSVIPPFLSYDFKTHRSFNKPKDLILHIQEILSISISGLEGMTNTTCSDTIELLTSRMLELPPPKRTDKDLWDQLTWEESHLIIKGLVQISLNVDRLLKTVNMRRSYETWETIQTAKPFYSQGVITLYTFLAIVDKLARKCPKSELGNQPIFFHPLFYQKNHSYFDNPALIEQLEHLEAYFDFQMTSEPDENLLDKLKYETLFFPIFGDKAGWYGNEYWIRLETNPKYCEITFLNKYIPLLFSKPELLIKYSITINEKGELFKKGVKTDSSVLLNILFHESFITESELIPAGYHYLNIQCRLCQNFICEPDVPFEFFTLKYASEYGKKSEVNFHRGFLDTKWNYSLSGPLVLGLKESLSYDLKRLNVYRKLKYFVSANERAVFKYIRTESKVYDDDFRNILYTAYHLPLTGTQKSINQQFELIHVQPTDIPLRVLGFLKNLLPNYQAFPKCIEVKSKDFAMVIRYCYFLLFSRKILKEHLERNPELAKQFGTILSDLIAKCEFTISNDVVFLLYDLSLTLQNYCQKYAPDHIHHFPNIREKGKQWEKKQLQGITALAIGPPDAVKEGSQFEAAVEIAERFFHSPFVNNTESFECSYYTLEALWADKLRCLYFQWLPLIRKMLNNPTQRNRFCNTLLNQPTDSLVTWESVPDKEDCYTNGCLLIDLRKGKIMKGEPEKQSPIDKFDIVNKFLSSLGLKTPASLCWSEKDEGAVEDKESGFVFCFNQDRFKAHQRFLPSQQFFSTNAFFIRNMSIEISVEMKDANAFKAAEELLSLMGYETTSFHINEDGDIEESHHGFLLRLEKGTYRVFRRYSGKLYRLLGELKDRIYWLEETENKVKELFIYDKSELIAAYKIEKTEAKNQKIVSFLKEGVEHIPISDPMIARKYSRFCSSNQIICWKVPNEKHLKRIDFLPYQLSFSIALVDNIPKATLPDLLPGYFIAEEQEISGLAKYPSYLLLENSEGQRKVMIGTDHWKLSLCSPLLSQLGSFAPLLTSFFLEHFSEKSLDTNHYLDLFEKKVEKPSYLLFSLEQDGELLSESPKSLAWLILFSLMHWQEEEAERAALRLQSILKLGPIDPKELKHLIGILSLIPPQIQRISIIRRGLFAAIAENNALYQVKEDDGFSWIHYSLVCMLYLDLTDLQNVRDSRYQLSAEQEWKLFELLSQSLFKALMIIPDFVQLLEVIQGIEMWELFFTEIALNNSLKKRYQYLKTSLGYSSSMPLDTLKIVWSLAKEMTKPSAAYTMFIQHVSPILEPLKRFKPNIETKGDWIQLFMGLYEYYKTIRNPDSLKAPLAYCSDSPLVISETWTTAEEFYRDFITAYLIAKGQATKQKAIALKRTLKFYRGGWDAQSSLMIEILLSTLRHPILFPKKIPPLSEHLQWLKKINQTHHLIKIKDIVTCLGVKLGETTLTSVAPHLILYGALSATSLIPIIGPALMNGSLSFNAYVIEKGDAITQLFTESLVMKEEVKPVVKKETLSKIEDYFSEIDPVIDRILNQAYAKTFIESFIPVEKVPSFSKEETSFNTSLQQYYARAEPDRTLVSLANPDRLIDTYFEISFAARHLSANLDKELVVLLEILNKNAKGLVKPLGFRDLITFFLDGSFTKLSEQICVEPRHLHLIEANFLRYLIKRSRLQQLNRILDAFEILSRFPPDSQEYECQMEQLIIELKSRRSYKGMNLSSRVIKRILLIEIQSNKMIWPRQSGRIKERFKQENALFELIMGMGKTEIFTSLENLSEADGSKIIINIWPSSLIHTNIRFLSKQSQQLFDQAVNHIQVKNNPSKMTYITFQHLLKRIRSQCETISQTKEEMQSFELNFIDYLNQAFNHNNKLAYDIAKEVGTILWLMRNEAKIIVDEAHVIFNEKEELLHASGRPTPINIEDFRVILDCFGQLTKDACILDLMRTNQLSNLSSDEREAMTQTLAERLSQTLPDCLNNPQKKVDFISYVTNRCTTLPQWITLSPDLQKMAMMKGIVTVYLSMLFERFVNVDFGPSLKNENEEFARPYEANTCPREQSTIRNPHEAAFKTIWMLIYKGLSPQQIQNILELMQKNAAVESPKMNLKIDDTPSGKRFLTFTKTIPLSKVSEHKEELVTVLKDNLKAIFWYLEVKIHPQILFWEINFRSNCHNFDAMFRSRDYKTGTPYNEGNYPSDITINPEPGTTGEGLHTLDNKCADKPIHILKQENPEAILTETLHTFFNKGSRFSALIDGGAKLTGLDSFTVARKMVAFVKVHRPDVTAIDFFYRDPSGVDKLMSWPVDAASPVPYDQCRVPLIKRLAYYDQFHGFGANLKQRMDGKSFILIGLRHHLYRLLQEAFRMRGLSYFRFFLSEEMQKELRDLDLNTTQSVEFALTPRLAELIALSLNKKPEEINLRDLLLFAEGNQKADLKQSYFLSFRQKASNIPRRAILDKLLESIVHDSRNRTLKMYAAVRDLLTSKMETNPILLYHNVTKEFSMNKQMIPWIKTSALDQARKTGIFNASELAEMKQKLDLIPIYPMAETLQVPIHEKLGCDFNQLQNLDIGCEVNVEQGCEVEMELEQEQDQEQEHETEVDQEQEIDSQKLEFWSSRFKENSWSETIAPYSLDWMKFSHPQKKSSISSAFNPFGSTENTPALFLVKDLLKYSHEKVFNSLEKSFSNKIWFSNNFLPTYSGLARQVLIGSLKQRELFKILVHMDRKTGKILSVGCLSQAESSWWHKHLINQEAHSHGEMAAFLYDMQVGGIVAGSIIPAKTLESHPEFEEIQAQLQFLNGDVSYDTVRIPALNSWIKKNNRDILLNAFFVIHRERGKYDFDGSILSWLLKND